MGAPCHCMTDPSEFNHCSPHSVEVEIVEMTPNEEDAYDYVVRCTCGRQATVTSYEIGFARCAYNWHW